MSPEILKIPVPYGQTKGTVVHHVPTDNIAQVIEYDYPANVEGAQVTKHYIQVVLLGGDVIEVHDPATIGEVLTLWQLSFQDD